MEPEAGFAEQPQHALIVDDDVHYRDVLARSVYSLGHEFTLVDSLSAANDILKDYSGVFTYLVFDTGLFDHLNEIHDTIQSLPTIFVLSENPSEPNKLMELQSRVTRTALIAKPLKAHDKKLVFAIKKIRENDLTDNPILDLRQ